MKKNSATTEETDEEIKSKTQIKQEMHALQALGEALLEVPMGVYKSFPIPAELDEVIKETRKITSNIARKRQLQYLGKVMRQVEIDPIQSAYDEWKSGRKKIARNHHHLEETRDKLIEGDKTTLNEVIEKHPECNIQQLRQLIRLAQQERKLQKPPKNYRKLFQFLKELQPDQ